MNGTELTVHWRPQAGPQKALIDCPISEIFYGGARGGGKTDGILGKYALKASRYGQHFNAVFFRKEMPQQDDLIDRAKEIYIPLGAQWLEAKKRFSFPGGGRVRFRPLENVADAEKYQGQNLSDAAVEEAGNYAMPAAIDRLFGCLRSTAGVPVQLILTANPGGPGHHWIKARYIDPAPLGFKTLRRRLPNGEDHRYVYIPSRVQHNRILLANDPGYVGRLYLVGSAELVRAWLEGDWNVIAGAFFKEFSIERHVIEPIALPAGWQRFRACDWGSAKPFSVGWYAVSEGDLPQFPRGALVKYREWYGMAEGQPNVGLKMTAEEVADGIVARDDRGYEFKWPHSVIDPSAMAENGGPSIAERMLVRTDKRVAWREADNKRVSARGALGGWDQLRSRLIGTCERDPKTSAVDWDTGEPMLYFFSTCVDTIRTVPALQHDDDKPEDVDSDGEDHAPDETRYACMSRPFLRKPRPGELPVEQALLAGNPAKQTIGKLVNAHLSKRRRERQEMFT